MVNTSDPSTPEQQDMEAALARFGGDVVKAASHLSADPLRVQAVWLRMDKINGQADGRPAARRGRTQRKRVSPSGPQVEPTEGCGTPAAYRRHIRLGENADDRCRAAKAEDSRERRAARNARRAT